jgi:hypothetical protein
MQPTAHGTFTLEWHGEILHTFPRGNFNEYGIIELKKQVLEQIANHEYCVVFDRPSTEAGITPDAIHELGKAYDEYQQHGCILVILEVPSMFGSAIKAEAAKHTNMPVICGTDAKTLAQNAQDALNPHT